MDNPQANDILPSVQPTASPDPGATSVPAPTTASTDSPLPASPDPLPPLPPLPPPMSDIDVSAGQPLPAVTVPPDSEQTIPDSRSLVALPEEAGDNDLIEKEWVVKAKQIVEHTAEDPFTQQQELNKIRADYMKKRYSKDIGTAPGM
ncbi:MAG: hypothetical protein ACR2FM_04510 [Candidatus Saccharimonadales bacterium]